MDKDLLVYNIRKYCAAAKIKPTAACIAAGVGKSFISNITTRGQTPSVGAVADLAAYLGVTTSDLVGDGRTPAELAPLADAWEELNDEGRRRLTEYADDLVAGGKYIKNRAPAVGAE